MGLDVFYTNAMDFFIKLRSANTFDDTLYSEIYTQIETLVEGWKTKDEIPKQAFITCIYLVDTLACGNRFLSDEDQIKVEDASIAVNELITTLDNHPPYDEEKLASLL